MAWRQILKVEGAILIGIAGVSYPLYHAGFMPPPTLPTVAEAALAFCFPLVMFRVHAIFRCEITSQHIGREFSWLGLAVVVSLISTAIGTLNPEVITLFDDFTNQCKILLILASWLVVFLAMLGCEFLCKRIRRHRNRGSGRFRRRFYAGTTLVLGSSAYMASFIQLLSRRH